MSIFETTADDPGLAGRLLQISRAAVRRLHEPSDRATIDACLVDVMQR